jgi:putative restriction endonuclease
VSDRETFVLARRTRVHLDAAHIVSDAEGGEPIVPNGISMCKIHHAPFDNSIIGIRPDYRVEVREDIRAEEDGPTLRYALQEVHGTRIDYLPYVPHAHTATWSLSATNASDHPADSDRTLKSPSR